MRRTLRLLIALVICVFSFHAALAADAHSLSKGSIVYQDPGYYSEAAETIKEDGVFTIAQTQQDICGNLWGKLESGTGWVALSSENYPLSLYAGDQIHAGPGYDFDVVKTMDADGTFTITAQAWDNAGNLWGRLRSGAGWVFLKGISAMVYTPISAAYADEELIAKGPYEYILIDRSLEATEIVLYANETLTDVCFFEHVHDGDTCTKETLHTLPALTTEMPLVAAVAFYGDMTAYGISFTDASGAKHCFEISISGMDGSLMLSKCTTPHS